MTITIEQLEHEAQARPLRKLVAMRAAACRAAFRNLEEAMRELHGVLPGEHICSFTLTAPEIPSDQPPVFSDSRPEEKPK